LFQVTIPRGEERKGSGDRKIEQIKAVVMWGEFQGGKEYS
jgi:hypothetical protein